MTPPHHDSKAIVALDDVVATEAFHRRPSRPPNFEAESRALSALADALADAPEMLLDRLVEITLGLCNAGSVGVSLLRQLPGGDDFVWSAIAGRFAPYVGGGTRFDFGPCGTTIERGAPQLFVRPSRFFTYFDEVEPPIVEGLLVPFRLHGEPAGTVWVVSHDEDVRFDGEDLRLVSRLSSFAAAALTRLGEIDALRDARARLDATLEVADIGTWMWDVRRDVVVGDRNLARMFGGAPGLMEGAPLATFLAAVHADDRERVAEAIRATIDRGGELATEYRLVAPDGEEYWVAARGRVERNADGEPVRMPGVAVDVTARRRAEAAREDALARERVARAAAEAASHSKDEFLATVSHELRTPLNAMLGWTGMLKERSLDEHQTAHALDVIERNAHAQVRLVDDLLDVSRIISGTLRIDRRSVEPSALVEAAVEAARPYAEAKGVALEYDADSDAVAVLGDATRLQQVVSNLLSNAIKFTPRGGRVRVEARGRAGYVELSVEDTGAGISERFLPHVFDRFSQADGGASRRHGGLGLGLAIVRSLVDFHGGTVRAESAGENLGARFVVTLPHADRVADEQARHATPDESSPSGPSLADVRVLVVDDDADARDMLQTALHVAGAAVRTAASASEALTIVGEVGPDVLISDIGMPVEDGYALLRAVRKLPDERGGRVPAIALTAYARPEDRALALAAGFDEHVVKPVDVPTIVHVIAGLVDETRMRR